MPTRIPLHDAAIHAALILEIARRRGLSAETLAADAGITPPAFEHLPGSIPYQAVTRLMSGVLSERADRNLGLEMAQLGEPTLAGLIGYYVVNQPALRDILSVSYDILGRVSNVFRVDLATDCDPVRFALHPTDPGAPRLDQMAEFHLAIFVRNTRAYVSPQFRPLRVAFAHRAPQERSALDAFFGCPVAFEAPVSHMEFDAAWLDAPVPAADLNLKRALRPYAQQELQHLPHHHAQSERVHVVLRMRMGAASLTLRDVARHLGLAPRTLQHRLQREGTTFQALLDGTRRSIALEALRDTQDPVEWLSSRLGFTDTGAFYRAFRRWTGTTPQAYRRQHVR